MPVHFPPPPTFDVIANATDASGQPRYSDLQGALNAAAALNRQVCVRLYGTFSGTAQIEAKSNVDVELHGEIIVTSDAALYALNFNNVQHSRWRGGVIRRRQATAGVASQVAAINFAGTTDRTCVLEDMQGVNEVTAAVAGCYGIQVNTCSPTLVRCTGTAGGSGATAWQRGLFVNAGAPWLQDCVGNGGGDTTSTSSDGICLQEPMSSFRMDDCEGYSGTGGGSGILLYNALSGTMDNCLGICRATQVSGSASYGINFAEGTVVTARNCIGIASQADHSVGINLDYQAAPVLIGCVGRPAITDWRADYAAANSGRFRPFATYGYQIMSFQFWVDVAQSGKTIDIGTTVGGHEIAQAVDIAAVGNRTLTLSRQKVVAGGYIYLTPSGSIPDACLRVYYSVMYDVANVWGGRINTAGFARLTNCHFLGADTYGALRLIGTSNNWQLVGGLIENLSAGNFAVWSETATRTNVPIYGTRIIGAVAGGNIVSFAQGSNTLPSSGTWTVASGQTSVVVTHGLGWTPAAGDVAVGFTSLGNAATCYIDTYTATQFTVHVNTDPGASTATGWWKANR